LTAAHQQPAVDYMTRERHDNGNGERVYCTHLLACSVDGVTARAGRRRFAVACVESSAASERALHDTDTTIASSADLSARECRRWTTAYVRACMRATLLLSAVNRTKSRQSVMHKRCPFMHSNRRRHVVARMAWP
jgi:hypothetical protein